MSESGLIPCGYKYKDGSPHLTYGSIFGTGSESDYQSCAEANGQMALYCIDIWVELSRTNCENYDAVTEMLNNQTEAYGIAREHYSSQIPKHTAHK